MLLPVLPQEVQNQLDSFDLFGEPIAPLLWMEELGKAMAQEAIHLATQMGGVGVKTSSPNQIHIGIFLGPGKKGGEGLVAARHLCDAGFSVRTFLIEPISHPSSEWQSCQTSYLSCGGQIELLSPNQLEQLTWLCHCTLLIDALVGGGISRPMSDAFLFPLSLMQGQIPVFSFDIPSGIHPDTGQVWGEAVRATKTLAFPAPKPGHFLEDGPDYVGELQLPTLPLPHPTWPTAYPLYTFGGEHPLLPRRPRNSHKGTYGAVFLIAGSVGYTGAPVFSAQGAVRSGAGLVFLAVPSDIYPIVASRCTSAMPLPLPASYEDLLRRIRRCDVLVLGPGLKPGPDTQKLVWNLLHDLDLPIVLDAEGINSLQGHIDLLERRRAPTILTPHHGEFARLCGCDLPLSHPLNQAKEFVARTGAILVLKGHRTLVIGPQEGYINQSGNPGMAKGGSGDILAGMIGAIVAQMSGRGEDWLMQATLLAVYLHGAAGDKAAAQLGEYSMAPEDLLLHLPSLIQAHTSSQA